VRRDTTFTLLHASLMIEIDLFVCLMHVKGDFFTSILDVPALIFSIQLSS
jgi:hypothetical protein